MKKFAEAKGVDLSTLTFQFDGEELSLTETPADLDMEEGDCVDVTGYWVRYVGLCQHKTTLCK